jgi:hypothetical protein
MNHITPFVACIECSHTPVEHSKYFGSTLSSIVFIIIKFVSCS